MDEPTIETAETGTEEHGGAKISKGMFDGVFTRAAGWLKAHWALFPLLLLAADFYWILWGNLTAIVFGIILLGIVGIDALVLKRSTLPTFKRYWPAIALLAIISLSMYIRLFGYFTPDGGTRWPYLRNIDSYHFFRMANTLLENNLIMPYDTYILAPFGGTRPVETYGYILASSYKFVSLFQTTPLWVFLAWFSGLLASLVVIPMYFLGRMLYDRKAGTLSALFMVLAGPFVSRSLGGDPDSDGIVMFTAIATLLLFFLSYRRIRKDNGFTKVGVLLSCICGLSFGFFALLWGGYWFSMWVASAFLFVIAILELIANRKQLRKAFHHIKILILYAFIVMLTFYIVTVPFYGIRFLSNPIDVLGFTTSWKAETGMFPNVVVSIAEAMPGGNLQEVVTRTTSVDIASNILGIDHRLILLASPLVLTLACFVYLVYSYYRRREHLDTLIFLGVWFVGFVVATMIAIRWGIWLVPVYALCSSVMISKLWHLVIGEERMLAA